MLIYQRLIKSPLGNLKSLFSINGLCYLGFQDETPGFIQKYLEKHTDKMELQPKVLDLPKQVNKHMIDTISWLECYFKRNVEKSKDADAGKTKNARKTKNVGKTKGNSGSKKNSGKNSKFREAKLPCLDFWGRPFEKSVWETLLNVSFGATQSYGEIAKQMQQQKASRAVGRSVGNNPIALIIPCHRIVGSNGKLVGFRSGLKRKQWLLQHEGVVI